jgi:hypothetical protein
LPSLEFFCALIGREHLILETQEHYEKQSYRNRCYINTDKGIQLLTVPVSKPASKIPSKDVRIDYQTNWQNIHWRTIQSAYAKAPFFEHYSESLKKIIFQYQEFLLDLNKNLLSFCLKSLKLNFSISESVSYEKEVSNEILDLRSAINAKNKGNDSSIYQSKDYYQVFGNAFVSNLSLIDLLFCAGPDSLRILKASQKVDLNK